MVEKPKESHVKNQNEWINRGICSIEWERQLVSVRLGALRKNPVSCNMETYITMCKIDSQRKFAVWLRKLKQGLCINLEGWGGEGDGREVQQGWDICIPMADSC